MRQRMLVDRCLVLCMLTAAQAAPSLSASAESGVSPEPATSPEVSCLSTDSDARGSDMMPKVSDELIERFRKADLKPDHSEAVIVTMVQPADRKRLERAGMQVERVIGQLPIAVGRVDAAALAALCRLDDVVRIELDSPMHAIGR